MGKRKKLYGIQKILLLIVITTYFQLVHGQGDDCEDGAKTGPDNPRSFDKELDDDQGYGYVIYSDLYTVKCCGVVTKWTFSVGDTGPIELQIWRPIDDENKKFKLVGYNTDEVTRKDRKAGFVSMIVDENERISAQEGDVIGWYAHNDSLVEYKDGTSNKGIWKIKHDNFIEIEEVVDFGAKATKQSQRTYGIQITLGQNSPPSLGLLLATSVGMDAEVNDYVYVLDVHDDDKGDRESLKVEMITDNEFFKFDNESHVLSVGSQITVPKEGKVFSLDFKVTDQCGNEGFGTLNVNGIYKERQTLTPTTVSTTTKSTTIVESTTTKKETTKTADSGDDTTVDDSTDKTKPITTSTTVTTTSALPSDDGITDRNITETPDTGSEIASNIGLVVGVVIAVAIVVIIIVAVAAYCISKKGKAKTSPNDVEKTNVGRKPKPPADAKKAEVKSNDKLDTKDEKAKDSKVAQNGVPAKK